MSSSEAATAPPPASSSRVAGLGIAAISLAWGTVGVIVKEVDLPAVAIVQVRTALAVPTLGLFLLVARRWLPGTPFRRRTLVRAVCGGVLVAAHWVCFFAAFKRAPVGTVLLITFLAPVLIAVAAPVLLGERVDRRTIAGLVLGLAGSALVVGGPGGSGTTTAGLVLAFLAAVSYAGLVLMLKPVAETHGGVRVALVEMAVATVVLVPFTLTSGATAPPAEDWALLAVLGVVLTGAFLGIYYSCLARVPATEAGVLSYLEPAAGVVFGWWLLGEPLTVGTVAGGILIVVAGVLVLFAPNRPPVTSPEVAGVPG